MFRTRALARLLPITILALFLSCIIVTYDEEAAALYGPEHLFVVVGKSNSRSSALSIAGDLRTRNLFRRYCRVYQLRGGEFIVAMGPYDETRAARYLERARNTNGGGSSYIAGGDEIIDVVEE